MASRADMIRRARRRVDARRDARNRANIRDQYRANYGRNLGKRRFAPTEPKVGGAGDVILNEVKRASNLAGTMLKDTVSDPARKGIGRFIDFFPEGNKEKFLGLPKAAIDAATRNFEEVEAAKRDDDKFTWGGDPIAVDKGSPSYQFLLNQMEDKDAFKKAVKDDKVFYTGLEEMSGDNYEASHPGYIALLNDPSRLKDMAPIRALNYMRSITGDPSNMGFDEFETLRQEQPNVYGGLTATEIAKKLLPQYQTTANEMYGDGFIANKAREYVDVDPEIMNYRDPIRDMVAPTGTGQSMVADLNPRTPPLSQSELMNVSEQNLMPTYDYDVYGDPMDNILYGEPGSGTGSLLLQSMYPGYSYYSNLDSAQKYGLEDMNERELMKFGYTNPPMANLFGFNPNYEFE